MLSKLAKEYNRVVRKAFRIIARTKSKNSKTATAARAEMFEKFPWIEQDSPPTGDWKIIGRAHKKTFNQKLKEIDEKDPDMIGLRDPQDPSRMNYVRRPVESR